MIKYSQILLKSLESQRHRFFIALISLCQILLPAKVLAAQNALVSVDKAIIYADQKMSAPVGYVSRGKTVRIGEIPKNKAQVYPVIVSGRIAYIRAIDVDIVSTENKNDLKTERFQESTRKNFDSNYSLSFMRYSAQIALETDNGGLKDKDKFDFNGVSLFGQAMINTKFDIDVLINYLEGKGGDEIFRMIEVGAGPSLKIVDTDRFKLRWHAHLLLIPFTNYAFGDKFRINSYGVAGGSGLKIDLYFTDKWAIELTGGMYYTKLFEFDAPKNYKSISPSFMGTRSSIGLNYRF